jgi:hypothetical protein
VIRPTNSHLIVHLYTDLTKQRAALAMIGLIAGISNSLGIVLFVTLPPHNGITLSNSESY